MDTVKAEDAAALLIEDAVAAVLMDDPWPAGLRLVDGEAAELAALPELPAAVLRPVGGAAPVAAAVAGPAAAVDSGELAVRQAPPAAAPDAAPVREPASARVAARVAEWAGMGLRLAGIGPEAAPVAAAPAPVAASAAVPEPQDWPLLSVLPALGGAAAPVVAGEAALPGAGAAPMAAEAGAAPVARDVVRWNDESDPGFAPVAAPASAWPGLSPAAPAPAGAPPDWARQDAGGEEAAAPEAAMQGVIEVDGAALGRFVAEHLAREAGRPPSGMTGFDPLMTPGWGGGLQG